MMAGLVMIARPAGSCLAVLMETVRRTDQIPVNAGMGGLVIYVIFLCAG